MNFILATAAPMTENVINHKLITPRRQPSGLTAAGAEHQSVINHKLFQPSYRHRGRTW